MADTLYETDSGWIIVVWWMADGLVSCELADAGWQSREWNYGPSQPSRQPTTSHTQSSYRSHSHTKYTEYAIAVLLQHATIQHFQPSNPQYCPVRIYTRFLEPTHSAACYLDLDRQFGSSPCLLAILSINGTNSPTHYDYSTKIEYEYYGGSTCPLASYRLQ